MLLLDQYIRAFKKLKRAHNDGGAAFYPILLPTNSAYRPAIENLTWHRENVFLR